jgi:hypothetical protein
MNSGADTTAAARHARAAGEGFVDSRLFAVLARAGFVARGLVYGIIGLLALDLALGHGGKITNQQGALRSIVQHSFGHLLLAVLAGGLAGYSLWRLFRAVLGHGPEGADTGLDRLGAFGSGIAYAVMCAIAVQILEGSNGKSGNAKKTTNDIFGWPGGRWLVGIAGLVMVGVGLYQLIRGARQKFLDDSNTQRMSQPVKTWFTALGTVGHLARAVVFGLVGIFLVKASIDYKANVAIGLDGALAKLYDGAYGSLLLGVVAAGLVAFAAFSIAEARYRRI